MLYRMCDVCNVVVHRKCHSATCWAVVDDTELFALRKAKKILDAINENLSRTVGEMAKKINHLECELEKQIEFRKHIILECERF